MGEQDNSVIRELNGRLATTRVQELLQDHDLSIEDMVQGQQAIADVGTWTHFCGDSCHTNLL